MSQAEQLLQAVASGDEPAVCRLLESDPALADSRDSQGVSALMQAIYRGQMEIAARFASAGRRPDVFEAAALGDLDRLVELLERNPSLVVAYSADGFTALHLAAFFGHPSAVGALLHAGAAVDAESRNSMRVHPLHSAAAANRTEAVRLLLRSGADARARQHGGYTALMSAASHGNTTMVRDLLDHGAEADAVADEGQTARSLATERDHEAVLPLLAGR